MRSSRARTRALRSRMSAPGGGMRRARALGADSGPPSGAASAGRLRNLSNTRGSCHLAGAEFTAGTSEVDDDDALLSQLPHRVGRSLTSVSGVLDAPVGHLV